MVGVWLCARLFLSLLRVMCFFNMWYAILAGGCRPVVQYCVPPRHAATAGNVTHKANPLRFHTYQTSHTTSEPPQQGGVTDGEGKRIGKGHKPTPMAGVPPFLGACLDIAQSSRWTVPSSTLCTSMRQPGNFAALRPANL